jgi:O-antigen/teichoic acid export membrane protein
VLTSTRALQIFQLLRIGSMLMTSVALAKSGLPTGDIGVYELLLYLGSTATFFWLNGLLQGLPPVFSRLQKKAGKEFIFNVFLLFCAISSALFLVLQAGERWITPWLTGRLVLEHYDLFCWYLWFNLPSYPVEYFYLLRERPRQLVSWGAINFVLHLAAVYVPIRLGAGLHGSLMALVALAVVKWVWTLGLALHYGRPSWQPGLMRLYLRFSGPLVLNVIIGNLIYLFDNWLVGWHYRDEAVFALYRYGSRELPLATALATALGVAMIPRLTANPAEGRAELKAKAVRLFHAVFPLTIVLLFLSGPLFPLVFNPDFAASAPLFNIYLLLTASRMLLPNSLVLAQGAPRVIFLVGLAELAVKVVLGFWFIRWWGLPGLAWSAVAAFWVEKLGLIWWLERRAGVDSREWLPLGWFIAYTALLYLAFAVSSLT